MKKLVLITLVLAATTMLYTSCDKEAEIAPSNIATIEKTLSPASLITNYKLLESPEISDASLNDEFILLNDGTVEEELPLTLDENSGKFHCPKVFKDSLYYILSQLDLTKEQAAKIHYALKEFHKCKMFNHMMMRKLNHELMMKANKERMIILEKLKNNKITKEEAEKELKALHEKIKFVMKNDPARKKVLENLYKCHQEFIENLRLILTKEQWDELMLYLKKVKV